ncbi:type II secretion system F family protein [Amaricoccus tamworthensis]|uniref:type II secretion system F family protein n=1 Tax=Amaricoccus tamworthensis TaxID=57002 RepID=UPI003C7CC0AF
MDSNLFVVFALSAGLSVVFILSGVVMWYLNWRARHHRVMVAAGLAVRNSGSGGKAGMSRDKRMINAGLLDFMRRTTSGVTILKDKQIKDVKTKLVSAGYRSSDALVVYSFFKLVAPFALTVGAAIYVYGFDAIGRGPAIDAGAVLLAALLGTRLPDMVLDNSRKKRLEEVEKSLPDALDMLVICAEAGLGSDMALKRVVAESGRTATVLGEELELTAMELGFSPDRKRAIDNLAARVPLPSVQAFANSMVQAEKYGTPLARAFKVLSQEQRNERMMRAEEKASRLPATMTVPMMVFILPALMIVLIGPAVISVMDNFVGR